VSRRSWLAISGLLAACTTSAPQQVRAVMEAPTSPDPRFSVPEADREVRGVWVTRWTYRSEGDLDAMLDDVASAGLTHVFLQVRGRWDAWYRSDLEPWASELTGTLGKDPGWDPLAYAVAAAHERGLELHAWVNVYAMWQGASTPRSVGVPHALLAHPEWRTRDRAGNPSHDAAHAYQFASPGNPAVADRVVAVVGDIGRRYDVDGILLDYVRYPGRDFGHETRPPEVDDFDEWRRQQIRETVARMHAATDKPLSAAVWGVYQDRWSWHVGGGYEAYYQDSHGMLDDGSLAAIAPMIYWPVASRPGARLDFRTLAEDHVREAGARPVWTGIEATKLSFQEIEACIRAEREVGGRGFVLFEYLALRNNGWLDDLAALLAD
jgi:uncharacterized lipoprotein YddW (UPF0748 family)